MKLLFSILALSLFASSSALAQFYTPVSETLTSSSVSNYNLGSFTLTAPNTPWIDGEQKVIEIDVPNKTTITATITITTTLSYFDLDTEVYSFVLTDDWQSVDAGNYLIDSWPYCSSAEVVTETLTFPNGTRLSLNLELYDWDEIGAATTSTYTISYTSS
ncbi:hypothetical protein MLD52_17225 [Puniceicoccaceae bacterium K14]|nr:hypothetical protein [Puniceicoccaceae bacterium K14]